MMRSYLFSGLATSVFIVGAVFAQQVDVPAPQDMGAAAVVVWAQSAGVDTDKMRFLGATTEGVFYGDPKISTPQGKPSKLKVRFERFTPATDAKGNIIRSETATLLFDCVAWRGKIEDVKAFDGRNAKGRSHKVETIRDWDSLAGADWTPLAQGGLLRTSRRDLCTAAREARADNVESARSLAAARAREAERQRDNAAMRRNTNRGARR